MRNTLTSLVVLMLSLPAFAGDAGPTQAPRSIQLKIAEHTQLDVAGLRRVSIVDPRVADVKVVGGTTLEVDAKCPGETALRVWGDRRYDFTLQVKGTPTNPADCPAGPAPLTRLEESRTVQVAVGETKRVSVPGLRGLTLAEPEIARAQPEGDAVIAVVGVQPGHTSILVLRTGQPPEAWGIEVR